MEIDEEVLSCEMEVKNATMDLMAKKTVLRGGSTFMLKFPWLGVKDLILILVLLLLLFW